MFRIVSMKDMTKHSNRSIQNGDTSQNVSITRNVSTTQNLPDLLKDTVVNEFTKGFIQPYVGLRLYSNYAPIRAMNSLQINEAIGINKANYIASILNINKQHCFSQSQYSQFIAGGGIGGNVADASIINQCATIFTNTKKRPYTSNSVLASYGLFVQTNGLLMSLANTSSPCRQVNNLLVPGGYLDRWCRNNNALNTLLELMKLNLLLEEYFGHQSQLISGDSQLVPYYNDNRYSNDIDYVGMSMCPCIWIVNFYLMYLLSPSTAAFMPAYWTSIPEIVLNAIQNSDNGQVVYSDYKQYLL